jgi:hypothetical protein
LVGIVTSIAKKIFAKNIWANEVIVPVAGVSIILAKAAQLIFKDNGLRRVVDFPNYNARHVGPVSSLVVLVKVGGMVDCRVRNDLTRRKRFAPPRNAPNEVCGNFFDEKNAPDYIEVKRATALVLLNCHPNLPVITWRVSLRLPLRPCFGPSRNKQLASSKPVSTTCTNCHLPSTPMSQYGVGLAASPDCSDTAESKSFGAGEDLEVVLLLLALESMLATLAPSAAPSTRLTSFVICNAIEWVQASVN